MTVPKNGNIGGYRWIDKDPVIDLFRHAMKISGMKYSEIAEESGVSHRTLWAWDFGKTRKPMRLTMRFAMAAMGFSEQWVNGEGVTLEVNYEKNAERPFKRLRGSA